MILTIQGKITKIRVLSTLLNSDKFRSEGFEDVESSEAAIEIHGYVAQLVRAQHS